MHTCPQMSNRALRWRQHCLKEFLYCRHNKNLNTDAWRKMQLWRHTANPGHPFNRFSTGNLETLLHTPKVWPHEQRTATLLEYLYLTALCSHTMQLSMTIYPGEAH